MRRCHNDKNWLQNLYSDCREPHIMCSFANDALLCEQLSGKRHVEQVFWTFCTGLLYTLAERYIHDYQLYWVIRKTQSCKFLLPRAIYFAIMLSLAAEMQGSLWTFSIFSPPAWLFCLSTVQESYFKLTGVFLMQNQTGTVQFCLGCLCLLRVYCALKSCI